MYFITFILFDWNVCLFTKKANFLFRGYNELGNSGTCSESLINFKASLETLKKNSFYSDIRPLTFPFNKRIR